MKLSKNAILPVLILFLAASCASKPPAPTPEPPVPTQPAPQPTPPAQPAAPAFDQAAMDALHAEVLALRKKAVEYGLNDLMADQYKAAEAAYQAGKAGYDAKDEKTAKTELEKARGLFKTLLDQGFSLLLEKGRAKAEEIRALAIKEGAMDSASDRLSLGSAAFDDASALAAEGKKEEALARYERARALFELSYKRALAANLKARIEKDSYASWDSGNYRMAENKFAEEANLFAASAGKESKDLAAGIQALDEAILRYRQVIEKGREGVAAASRTKSESSKARAESIKAQVAVKEDFAKALAIYKEGSSAFSAKEFETATAKFTQSESLFEAAYALAAKKRGAAEEAMKAAAAAAEESKRKAEEAEPILAETDGQEP